MDATQCGEWSHLDLCHGTDAAEIFIKCWRRPDTDLDRAAGAANIADVVAGAKSPPNTRINGSRQRMLGRVDWGSINTLEAVSRHTQRDLRGSSRGADSGQRSQLQAYDGRAGPVTMVTQALFWEGHFPCVRSREAGNREEQERERQDIREESGKIVGTRGDSGVDGQIGIIMWSKMEYDV